MTTKTRPNKTHTLNVRGITVRTRTPRRYVVCAFRAEDFVNENGTYVKFAEVALRTDNFTAAQTKARRMRDNGYRANGLGVCVIDTETGEEVT